MLPKIFAHATYVIIENKNGYVKYYYEYGLYFMLLITISGQQAANYGQPATNNGQPPVANPSTLRYPAVGGTKGAGPVTNHSPSRVTGPACCGTNSMMRISLLRATNGLSRK